MQCKKNIYSLSTIPYFLYFYFSVLIRVLKQYLPNSDISGLIEPWKKSGALIARPDQKAGLGQNWKILRLLYSFLKGHFKILATLHIKSYAARFTSSQQMSTRKNLVLKNAKAFKSVRNYLKVCQKKKYRKVGTTRFFLW